MLPGLPPWTLQQDHIGQIRKIRLPGPDNDLAPRASAGRMQQPRMQQGVDRLVLAKTLQGAGLLRQLLPVLRQKRLELPRFSGRSRAWVSCSFLVAPFEVDEGPISQSLVTTVRVIPLFEGLEALPLCLAILLNRVRSSRSHSSVAKKLSAMALSKPSPTEPIDGATPHWRQRSPKANDVLWQPRRGGR